MEATPNNHSTAPGHGALLRRITELEAQNARLVAENAALRLRLEKLERLLADRDRGNKRQAAPFSEGPPKVDPKTPGRKAGDDYGKKAFRSIPDPVEIDEVHDAPLPARCPHCGGGSITPTRIDHQYQAELPYRPIYRQFNIAVGKCACCDARVQGRHALQTSDALGCCVSQLGPNAQAAATIMNKRLGLSHGKIAWFFCHIFQIALTPGGVCQAMLRAARRTQRQRDEIVEHLQSSPWLVPDETGWRIGGKSAWMHTVVGIDATAYLVHTLRGYEATVQLINENYAGDLVHDGWAPYDRFKKAGHQTCLDHLLRRCEALLELCEGNRGAAAVVPRRIRALLMESLAVRDRRDAGEIKATTAARAGVKLQKQMVELTERYKVHTGNERLCKHIWNHQDQLFTFLKKTGLDATNHRAEQAIRPAVVNRKVWGGNRTPDGAWAQGVLLTVLETATRRGADIVEWLSRVLCEWPMQTPVPAIAASG